MPISVKSEIGTLKKILLQRPGRELEHLSPNTMEQLLFDDIPYLHGAQEEHDRFAALLQENGVEVLYLEDLTGDDSPELIYLWGWGGTGVWEDHVRVFDLATTAEYPVIWDNEALSAAVSAHIGSHEIISVEVGRLTLTTCFSSEDSRPGEYAGELSADFAFDAESASFLLQTPYTITVYNPNI